MTRNPNYRNDCPGCRADAARAAEPAPPVRNTDELVTRDGNTDAAWTEINRRLGDKW